MSEIQTETSNEELIQNTAEFIAKLIKENVLKFSFGPELSNPVPMIIDCLMAHDKGTVDPVVMATLDSIETMLKLSVCWMPDRVVVGVGVVSYENTMESKRRARMWALMLHVTKFKELLMSADYVG